MTEPEAPYGPGAICDDCGHFAGRHGVGRCAFPPESRSGDNKGIPCDCKGMLWRDSYRWDIPPVGLPILATVL